MSGSRQSFSSLGLVPLEDSSSPSECSKVYQVMPCRGLNLGASNAVGGGIILQQPAITKTTLHAGREWRTCLDSRVLSEFVSGILSLPKRPLGLLFAWRTARVAPSFPIRCWPKPVLQPQILSFAAHRHRTAGLLPTRDDYGPWEKCFLKQA